MYISVIFYFFEMAVSALPCLLLAGIGADEARFSGPAFKFFSSQAHARLQELLVLDQANAKHWLEFG